MHELACAAEIFEQLNKLSSENTLKRINKIKITVGAVSGINGEYLTHSLKEHLFPGTIFASAEILIDTKPPALECLTCGLIIDEKIVRESPLLSKCHSCGSLDLEIKGGSDVSISTIEGEKD